MAEICNRCKTGIKQLENYNAMKNKEITRRKYAVEAQKLAGSCFECIHNGIKGMKAWTLKKACKIKPNGPQFQSIDLFEAIK